MCEGEQSEYLGEGRTFLHFFLVTLGAVIGLRTIADTLLRYFLLSTDDVLFPSWMV